VWSWRPDAGVKFCETFAGRRWLKSPVHRGEHAISRKPSRRECLGRKTSIKSIVSAACVRRCVAICCGQIFSTTYPWKPHACCGRLVSCRGEALKTHRRGALRTRTPFADKGVISRSVDAMPRSMQAVRDLRFAQHRYATMTVTTIPHFARPAGLRWLILLCLLPALVLALVVALWQFDASKECRGAFSTGFSSGSDRNRCDLIIRSKGEEVRLQL
jgi:hypothetical protein